MFLAPQSIAALLQEITRIKADWGGPRSAPTANIAGMCVRREDAPVDPIARTIDPGPRAYDRRVRMDTVVAEVEFVADRSGQLQPLFSAPPS